MTPEEIAAAAAVKSAADAAAAAAAATKTPEQLAADAAAADAAKKAGTPPALNADGTPKVDQVDKDGKPIVDAGGAPEEKAPDRYDLKLGATSTVSKSDLAFFEKIARENNWSNDHAQALVEQQEVLLGEQSAMWAEELKADKTFGGEKLAETQQLANAAIDKLWPKESAFGQEVRQFLSRGIGNHRIVAGMLATIGRATLEDSVIKAAAASGNAEPLSAKELLYGATSKPG